MPKGFASMNVCPGEALAQITNPMLDRDEQNRLARAWMCAYLSGRTDEDSWRQALGYSSADWAAHRSVFAEVLQSPDGWGLPFMREELARQSAISQTKRDNRNGRQRPSTAVNGTTAESPAYANTAQHSKSKSKSLGADAPGFIRFWEMHPKKVGRKPCSLKWRSANLEARADEILAGLSKLIPTWNPGFEPNPLTFLNQERWNDEPKLNGHAEPESDGWEVTR